MIVAKCTTGPLVTIRTKRILDKMEKIIEAADQEIKRSVLL